MPRKQAEEPQEPVEPREPVARATTPQEPAPAQEPDPAQTPYYAGTWHGQPRWACPHCRFDSLAAGVVERHVRAVHERPEPRLRRPVELLDRFGRQLPVEEE